MNKIIEDIKRHTDLWPWYWLSYGEKEYAFATVEAYPANTNDPYPEPGTELTMNDDLKWFGENGTEMTIEQDIANIEQQNGDVICEFIAKAHSYFIGKEVLIS